MENEVENKLEADMHDVDVSEVVSGQVSGQVSEQISEQITVAPNMDEPSVESSECSSDETDSESSSNEQPEQPERATMFDNIFSMFTAIQPPKNKTTNTSPNDTDNKQPAPNPLADMFSMLGKLMNDNKSFMKPIFENAEKMATSDSFNHDVLNDFNTECMSLRVFLETIVNISNANNNDVITELKTSATKLSELLVPETYESVKNLPETCNEIKNFHKYYYQWLIFQLQMNINKLNNTLDDINLGSKEFTTDDLLKLADKKIK